MKFLVYLTGWLASLLFVCQPVVSQLRDTVNLDEVVVTGEIKPVLTDKSLYQIKSISAREIRGRGATNLSELLSNELSFRITQDAALGSSLSLNGLTGEHVKILIDGVPVVGRQAGILDLTQINLSKVDHIEVVEGPMSVIYGSNALGGVINIITQRPVYGDKGIYKVRTYYETVGVYNADIEALFTRNKHTFDVSGGRHFFGG
ncbi:MAG TPA: TonB-dependent receptor plug domain-containing protein, partial [Bacteroidales bacterium]|nr:TonB-dependent receptor plug domain-containing protein [Bacteroidales bacterium]